MLYNWNVICHRCDGGCIAVRLFNKKKKKSFLNEIHRSAQNMALQPV